MTAYVYFAMVNASSRIIMSKSRDINFRVFSEFR
jgi:hypothetical protein